VARRAPDARPFHDIDPVELADGQIAFTSTRIGRFEEYHNPPSRSLFVMDPAGREVRPLTHTIIFDNEPEVLADGRIVFIRSTTSSTVAKWKPPCTPCTLTAPRD